MTFLSHRIVGISFFNLLQWLLIWKELTSSNVFLIPRQCFLLYSGLPTRCSGGPQHVSCSVYLPFLPLPSPWMPGTCDSHHMEYPWLACLLLSFMDTFYCHGQVLIHKIFADNFLMYKKIYNKSHPFLFLTECLASLISSVTCKVLEHLHWPPWPQYPDLWHLA